MNGEEQIAEFEAVIKATAGKEDIVNRWARRGVISEAGQNLSYLKRRIIALWPNRKTQKDDIIRAVGYIRKLRPIFDA